MFRLVLTSGLEPLTSALSERPSDQLKYVSVIFVIKKLAKYLTQPVDNLF